MDKPEKDMPNKANPEKGKPEIDIHNSDKDKVQKMYSNPNDLQNLLKDLDDYESWAADSRSYNSTTSDRITPEPPDETPRSKKIPKMAAGAVVNRHNPHTNSFTQVDSQTGQPVQKSKPVLNTQPAMPQMPQQQQMNMKDMPSGFSPPPHRNHLVDKAIDTLGEVIKSTKEKTPQPGQQPQGASPVTASRKKIARPVRYMNPATGQFELPMDENGMRQVNDPMAGQHLTSIERGIMSGKRGPVMGATSEGIGMERGPWGHENHAPTMPPSMLAKTPESAPMKNVTPNSIQRLLGLGKPPKTAAADKHPEKDQTGVVDDTDHNIQDDSALTTKELDNLLEDTDAYMDYLGLSDVDYPSKKKASKLYNQDGYKVVRYKEGGTDKCKSCGKQDNQHFVGTKDKGETWTRPSCSKEGIYD